MASITLPFPPKELSPNSRLHWRALHKAKAAYKDLCAWQMLGQPAPIIGAGRIPLTITISPPDNRRRDRDNMQSSCKYAIDQLAFRLGVDDFRFDPNYRFAPAVKGGSVTVEIGA